MSLLLTLLLFYFTHAACVGGGDGNSNWQEGETCDIGDYNNVYGGAFANVCVNCVLAPGWFCFEGGPCIAAECGDYILAGSEECEYSNSDTDLWCDPETCKLNKGYKCKSGTDCN